MPDAFAMRVQPQCGGGWTMESIREMAMVPDFSLNEDTALFDVKKAEQIPDGFYPHPFFNPLEEGDVDGCGCTKVFISPEMFMENGCLKEDVARTVDSHGYTKVWQQWKI